MLLTEILLQKQQEIAALFEKLGSQDLRSEVGRRTILQLQGKLEEHFRLEDTLLLPSLDAMAATDAELRSALVDFHSGYHRLAEMLQSFYQRWDMDGTLPSEFRMEMDFLFNLVRHRLRLTQKHFYPAYEAHLAAA
jgi:hypothetical protein